MIKLLLLIAVISFITACTSKPSTWNAYPTVEYKKEDHYIGGGH